MHGTSPYTYSWNNGSNSATASNLSAGTYTITVQDSCGASVIASVTITQAAPFTTPTISSTDVSCNGGANGSASVSEGSGSPGGGVYTYTWSPGGQTTSSITGLSAGTYTITLQDNCGNSASASVNITQPNTLSVTAYSNPGACNGNSNGNATAAPSGGTSPYTYSWSTGATTVSTGDILSAGTYSVTVMDSCGGSVSTSVIILQSSPIIATTNIVIPITCNGASNGAANVGATGGISPYTYSWSSGGGTNDTISSYEINNSQTFSYEAAVQHYSIPAGVTQITVSLAGGEGGTGTALGGEGASFTGVCTVIPGHILSVVVGGMGASRSDYGGAGGGGSFVYDSAVVGYSPSGTTGLLAVAAGGGGGSWVAGYLGGAGGTDLVGNSTTNGPDGGDGNVAGGTGGNGGGGATGIDPGAGGAGWLSNGQNSSNSGGGNDEANGFTGGSGYISNDLGGYGGGGGLGGDAGSGGGGYNGGGGGNDFSNSGGGGGGGSFFNTAYGSLPGSATATNLGNGSVTITYLDPSPLGLVAGTYSVTVTDNNGCTTTASVTLTQPNALRDSIVSVTNVSCNGTNTGSATVGVAYGTSPYTYSWSSGGGDNATASGLIAGTYTVTVQDNCAASATTSVTITQPIALAVSASITSSNVCSGGGNGAAEASASGGSSPYTYSWSNGITTSSTGDVLGGGTYSVTVHDNCGASATSSINMPYGSLRDSIVASATVNDMCNGGATGSAEVGVKGGASPYTYLWSSGGGTNAIINSYGISSSQTFSYTGVIQNFAVPAGVTQITIGVTGAAGGYGSDPTYLGGNGVSFIGIATVIPGHALSVVVGGIGLSDDNTGGGGGASWVYDSTITGAHSGTPSLSALIAVAAGGGGGSYNNSGPSGGAGGTDLSGNSTTNGYSTNSAGGTGGNGGEGGQDNSFSPSSCGGAGGGGWLSNATGNSDGTNGNDWANSFAAAPGVDVDNTGGFGGGGGGSGCGGGGGGGYNGGGGGVSGVGGGDGGGGGSYLMGGTANLIGSITATNTGDGSVTISYLVASPSGLAAGTYSVSVTDNNGCSATASVTITQPSAINPVALAGANVSCNGGSNGQAKVSVSGGTPPYTYSWSPNTSSSYIANGLSAGTYTVSVTDHNGCSATSAATITQPTALRDSVAVVNYPQCGGETASATIGVQGGTAPYNYVWSPNVSTTATATGLSIRGYEVQVKDKNGCFKNVNFSITQPPVPVLRDSIVRAATINVSCNGGSNGSATAGVKYGATPYTYSWSNGAGNVATATGLSAGTYTVTVNDAASCMATAVAIIAQGSPLTSATAATSANVSCHGGSNGQAKVSVLGGTSPYIYSWSPVASSTYIVNGLSAGTYTVTVSDNCGASVSSSAIVTQPAVLFDSLSSITYPQCTGSTGSASIGVRGGTSPYRYTWTPNVSTTASAAGLSVRGYVVQVKDVNGCYNNLNFSISQPAVLRDSIVKPATVNVSCSGESNGSATVGVKYGTGPYTYSWSNGAGNVATATGLSAGTYTVMVSDGSCSATASVAISQPGTLLSTASVSAAVTCYGSLTGKAKVTVSGGSSPYLYSWSPVSSSATTATGLSAGTYTVTVTDNCTTSASSSVILTQPVVLFDSVASLSRPACGTATGSASIGVTGGTSPYRYTWTPNVSTTATATGLTARSYVVQVKDANGCFNNLTLAVSCTQPVTATYKEEASTPAVENINLYPNPNTGQFTISGLQTGMILEMYDYTGKKISSATTTTETMQLNIFNQADGVYLIRILDKDGNLITEKKVVKTQ